MAYVKGAGSWCRLSYLEFQVRSRSSLGESSDKKACHVSRGGHFFSSHDDILVKLNIFYRAKLGFASDAAWLLLAPNHLHMLSLLAKVLSFALLTSTSVVGGLASRLTSSSINTLDSCPGYVAKNIETTHSSLTADLVLAREPCNVFGQDIVGLKLSVVYEDGKPRTCQ